MQSSLARSNPPPIPPTHTTSKPTNSFPPPPNHRHRQIQTWLSIHPSSPDLYTFPFSHSDSESKSHTCQWAWPEPDFLRIQCKRFEQAEEGIGSVEYYAAKERYRDLQVDEFVKFPSSSQDSLAGRSPTVEHASAYLPLTQANLQTHEKLLAASDAARDVYCEDYNLLGLPAGAVGKSELGTFDSTSEFVARRNDEPADQEVRMKGLGWRRIGSEPEEWGTPSKDDGLHSSCSREYGYCEEDEPEDGAVLLGRSREVDFEAVEDESEGWMGDVESDWSGWSVWGEEFE